MFDSVCANLVTSQMQGRIKWTRGPGQSRHREAP